MSDGAAVRPEPDAPRVSEPEPVGAAPGALDAEGAPGVDGTVPRELLSRQAQARQLQYLLSVDRLNSSADFQALWDKWHRSAEELSEALLRRPLPVAADGGQAEP